MIIPSLLDTDLYKFTMMQVVLHHYPHVNVEYQFKLRTPDVDLSPFADLIMENIHNYCQLKFQEDELAYLQSLPYIHDDLILYLRDYQPNFQHVYLEAKDGFLLSIKGPWLETILFEIPLLAILSEIYYAQTYPQHHLSIASACLQSKIEQVRAYVLNASFRFSDFGTRRRFSQAWHGEVLKALQAQLPQQFVGTSNVYYAKQLQLKPIGTMSHEYIQAFQALAPSLLDSQKTALRLWLQEYGDQLSVALSDTLGLSAFLRDFDSDLAHRYQGVRQDSGEPLVWATAMLEHYAKLGIDAREKSFVFSDALTISKAIGIHKTLHEKVQILFGIGTHLTNDTGIKPLDMVIKMQRCDNKPVAKISDSLAKAICSDSQYMKHLKELFQIQ